MTDEQKYLLFKMKAQFLLRAGRMSVNEIARAVVLSPQTVAYWARGIDYRAAREAYCKSLWDNTIIEPPKITDPEAKPIPSPPGAQPTREEPKPFVIPPPPGIKSV